MSAAFDFDFGFELLRIAELQWELRKVKSKAVDRSVRHTRSYGFSAACL